MQSRSIRRSGQPTKCHASRMRAFDRDLIRGGHYGQRSCEPRQQAEHMAATDPLHREENPCQQGAVHTWHFSDKWRRSDDVCFVEVKRTSTRRLLNGAFADIADPTSALMLRPSSCTRPLASR